jgi:hypothetical protein
MPTPPNNDVVLFSELDPAQFEIAASKYRIKPALFGVANQVAVQMANPNMLAPTAIAVPVKGDVVVVTSDGTPTGQLQASYIWNGTTWLMQSAYTTPTAISSPTNRTYFTATTAFVDRLETAETAATIAARGFTAVGAGAAIAPSALGLYIMSFMLMLTTPTPTLNAASIAALYTIPTVYIRHELSITAGVANAYFLRLRSSGPDNNVDVWVCDPVSGVPVERLHGNATCRWTTGDTGTAFSLGPDESNGAINREYEWVHWPIPASVIAARKTATNTIKLAIRKGIGAGNGNNVDIAGYAMASVGNSQFVATPVFVSDNQANGGIQLPYNATVTGNPYAILGPSAAGNITAIPANTVTGEGVRISIPDITKDCYLSLFCHGNLYTYTNKQIQLVITSVTGPILLGRPRPTQSGPLAQRLANESGLGAMTVNGWLIPASVLAAKAVKPAII